MLSAGRLDEAEASFRLAIDIDPAMVEAQSNLGVVLLRTERCDEARDHLEAMVLREPESEELWSNLGVARSRCGDPEEARAAFERALAIDPTMVSARIDLVRALMEGEEWGRARAHLLRLDAALRGAGNADEHTRAEAMGYLAFAEAQLGRPRAAEARADEALVLDSRSAPARVVRGSLRAARGDLEGALEDLRSVEHDPVVGFAARVRLAALARLAGLPAADLRLSELVREAPEHAAVRALLREAPTPAPTPEEPTRARGEPLGERAAAPADPRPEARSAEQSTTNR